MQAKYYLLFLLLFIIHSAFAQVKDKWHLHPSLTDTQYLQFNLVVNTDQLGIAEELKGRSSNLLTDLSDFKLEKTDLSFQALPYGSRKQQYTDIGKSEINLLGISADADLLPLQPAEISVRSPTKIIDGFTYSINDIIENHLELNQEYTIAIERKLYTDFQPDEQLKKIGFIYDAAPIAVGIGGLLWANSLRMEGNAAYRTYEDLWQRGSTENVANPFYTTAQNRQTQSLIVAGSTILIAGVAEFLIWKKIRQKRNRQIALQQQIQAEISQR